MVDLPPLPIANPQSVRELLEEVIKEEWFSRCFQSLYPLPIPLEASHRDRLLQLGLVSRGGYPLFRVNGLRGRFFLTDGPWQGRHGAFPWTDESEAVLDYVESRDNGSECGTLIDPGAGCGHSPLAAKGSFRRIALDVDQRAVQFIRLNATMNNVDAEVFCNDIRTGLPISVVEACRTPTLWLINMPHALAPYRAAIPTTSYGGRTGLDLTVSALEASKATIYAGGRAVVLTYTLGNINEDRWDVYERVISMFPGCSVSWSLLDRMRIWRVNGVKSQPNPMPLVDGLPLKANCRLQVADEEREDVRRGYRLLAQDLNRMGWDVLGCGIIDVSR